MSINYKDYFCKLECCYWHEFDYAYGKLQVENKTIIIIGNDCGSSALYFLLKGAKKIIGYEKSDELNKRFKEKVCKEFQICDKVEVYGEWTGKEYPNADILVMDCEGCESKLDFSQLQKYKQYCIAIHDWTENRFDLMRKLYGTVLTFITDDNKEFIFCKL
ncbi:SAM-dependent methyltransferase [Sulfolobus islandicus rod-shaped virus 8]|uniref:Methyltransferase domain-containing protein n=2 Tax=Usarudivirus TaxID=2843109 RepID=A0A1X9SJJ0_9VIRU|nr:SAM-dependent methyltransferase [Sulfolobus islandicus rod-shaped virus 9]YP_009362719.1 SAM-dependent methyltransferase [Sulfolobus islandicus rod-shaped virus 8]ARQ96392.1 hypothetical protein [Sulfolobus islandicus rod-shaped virus 9]ARQ96452.1 hypothetical protein [Sulfolobus islandicus rod-shaped virus 8]